MSELLGCEQLSPFQIQGHGNCMMIGNVDNCSQRDNSVIFLLPKYNGIDFICVITIAHL
jgi:hypothetical protein